MMMPQRVFGIGLLAVLVTLTGCTLTEVTTPEGRDLLVVEGVLRSGRSTQSVLLHRSLMGTLVKGEPRAHVAIWTPQGEEVVLDEGPLESCTDNLSLLRDEMLVVEATCYTSIFTAIPGQSYELRVTTADGLTVRGRTTLPGRFDFVVPSANILNCALPPMTNLSLVWTQSEGAWAYLATIGVRGLREGFAGSGIEAPEFLQLTGLAISQSDTTIVLPREFGLFERFGDDQALLLALQRGFPAGTRVELVVSAADRNYVNGVRGGAFNPSGNVRISSVVGDGVGIFGSIVVLNLNVRVGENLPLPNCLR
ncbi:hypothetical protein BH23GEM8_BH23GEM8_17820 [soil metagenome]